MKRFNVFCAVLLLLVCMGACAESTPPEFSIRLLIPDIAVAAENLSIADFEPFLTQQDIVSYDAKTHEILLTEPAFKKVSELQVPVAGRCFVVCLGEKIQYSGAFWTLLSSVSSPAIVIMKPFKMDKPVITLEQGYPAPTFFTGTDPRNNPAIIEALRQAGKLK